MSSTAKVSVRAASLTATSDQAKNHVLVLAEKDTFKRVDGKAWAIIKAISPGNIVSQVNQLEAAKRGISASMEPFTLSYPGSNTVGEGVASETIEDPALMGSLNSFIIHPLPMEKSRNLGFIRSDKIPEAVARLPSPKPGSFVRIVVIVESQKQMESCVSAIARSFPMFSMKTKKQSSLISGSSSQNSSTSPKSSLRSPTSSSSNSSSFSSHYSVGIELFVLDGGVGPVVEASVIHELQLLLNAVRYAARLTDMPTSELDVARYVEEVRQMHKRVLEEKGVKLTVIQDDFMEASGFGGLWGVGKASESPPALVVLSYNPKNAKKTLVWIGKGIVYDTGGLSIKGKEHMPGMKVDMAGSANVLAAFEATISRGFEHNLHAILCLAENSVDSTSTRPDDILTLYSGKTVEINNTDAEGRLVLADGTAYATKHLSPDYIIDLATLTGAQSYATGSKHAGVLCNDEDFEKYLISCGKRSGDLLFPLIYCPEFLGVEAQFSSEVADMKNSVKDRSNAPSSGAGHFIEDHIVLPSSGLSVDQHQNVVSNNGNSNDLSTSRKLLWAHVDLAAPTTFGNGRGTGFGSSLLIQVANQINSL